jgi:hypothetical protein
MRLTDFWMDLLSTRRLGKILGHIDKTIFAIDCTIVAYIVMPLALSAIEATTGLRVEDAPQLRRKKNQTCRKENRRSGRLKITRRLYRKRREFMISRTPC